LKLEVRRTPKQDKDLAQDLIKFEIEMAEKINSEAELKLEQAKKEREKTLNEFNNLKIQSFKLISQPQNEKSVTEVLKSGIQLLGRLNTKLQSIILSLDIFIIKIKQTKMQILALVGEIDCTEQNPVLLELTLGCDRIESFNNFCL